MTHHDTLNEIRKMISEEDLLCQLAEECSELAQAALKLRRTMCGSNPTPVTHSEAVEALLEEAGDVLLCLRMIQETKDNWYIVDIGITEKAERWLNRLQEAQV